MKYFSVAEVLQADEELVDDFGNVVILQGDGLFAKPLEVKRQILQDN